jgi:hypothetical protein
MKWKMENAKCKMQIPFLIFHFPFSIFHFPTGFAVCGVFPDNLNIDFLLRRANCCEANFNSRRRQTENRETAMRKRRRCCGAVRKNEGLSQAGHFQRAAAGKY